jgi:DNA-binding NtrC family response regulator
MFSEGCASAGDAAARGDENQRESQVRAVLIVEDERVARGALRRLLCASGFAAEAAESAEEALDLLAHRPPPRVVLVDLDLPGMSGIDFIRRLEKIEPSVHPVLMTGASDEALGKALGERDVPFVRKPLDFPRLLSVINDAA